MRFGGIGLPHQRPSHKTHQRPALARCRALAWKARGGKVREGQIAL
jgi:hypothetical protein